MWVIHKNVNKAAVIVEKRGELVVPRETIASTQARAFGRCEGRASGRQRSPHAREDAGESEGKSGKWLMGMGV
jgi:hypothetical protein